jgi:hypothetical protein
MATGYCFARLLRPSEESRHHVLRIGLVLAAAFLFLRALNAYGDPRPWSRQASFGLDILSFLNCDKYPPSLLFLLMTMGPALCLLPVAEEVPDFVRRPLATFGRVPLFYYLVHLPLIHLLAVLIAWARGGPVHFLFENPPSLHGPPFPVPEGYGYGLPVVYAIWAAVVIALYPICRWFAGLKRRSPASWLRYL